MKLTGQVAGFKELEQALKRVDKSVGPKALRSALKKAADSPKNSIQRSIAANFESQSGVLANSIKVRATLNKKQTHNIYDAAVYVGVYNVKALQKAAGGDIPVSVYAYWLETGVKPHDLNAKSKRSRGKVGSGQNNFHPGIEPKPFIRPALINNSERVISDMHIELKRKIDLALKRAAKQKR
ncbi:HK97 gp10 family phage protein [Pseudoalteromonas sp. S16_S37]|uniref:HK97 gp10 family phage protein n=1 Tax=Pseudoalteromonas sp. S16_S37 TaxID=2720228 RepID=UPI0016816B6E|nr:HK97 gp10 family phage protein [Pseudoalteromonas sp. S16_S37]MBD1583497.1 hypothetical protein [Pseudoalteromonas sp. S16_S37]